MSITLLIKLKKLFTTLLHIMQHFLMNKLTILDKLLLPLRF